MSNRVYLVLPNKKSESLSANLLTNPDFKRSAFCTSCRSLVDPALLQWLTGETPYSNCEFMFSSYPLAFALHDDLAAVLGKHLNAFYWMGLRTMEDAYVPGWLGLIPRPDTIVIPFQSNGRDERSVCSECGNELWKGYGYDIAVRASDIPPYEIFSCAAGMLLKENARNAIEKWLKHNRDFHFNLSSIPVVELE